jgi:hypothetical protein
MDGGGKNGIMRQEGVNVYIYHSDPESISVIYDFSKTVGDTVYIVPIPFPDNPTYNDTLVTIIAYEDYLPVFGIPKRLWAYYTYSTRSSYYDLEEIVDGFGVTYSEVEAFGDWYLRGAIIDGVRYGTLTSVEENPVENKPTHFVLYQNYPNPFNNRTTLSFYLPKGEEVYVTVYDVLGREIRTLARQWFPEGTHRIFWDAKNNFGQEVPSGLYFYEVKTVEHTKTGKMLLLK